ncbi:MAG: ABC transporter substrate-binding protein [Acidimicrobiales bacterium]
MTNEISRRTFLKTSSLAAGALALPGALRVRETSRYSSLAQRRADLSKADDVLTIGLPVAATDYKHAAALLSNFTKQTGITINPFTTNTPSNSWVAVFQEISTRLAGGEPVDTAYIATEGMLLFETQGLLAPLGSYIAKDQKSVQAFYDDVNPQMLSNFRRLDDIRGAAYFLPIGYNVMSMWYNREVFKTYKLPDPEPGWTWDEFLTAATKIADAPNRYGFAIGTPTPGPFTDIYPWVLTNGAQIMNADQTKCVANNPGAIEAATFVRELVKKKLVNAPGGAYNSQTETVANRLGMFGAGIWPNVTWPIPQSEANKRFAIVPWPKHVRNGTPVGVGGFPIFEHSAKKAAIWEFIKYTISEEFQRNVVFTFGGDMPIRQSVARSASFLRQFPPGTENFSTELSYSTMIVGVPNASAVESEMSTMWEEIASGGISPADGMAQMESQCNAAIARKIG